MTHDFPREGAFPINRILGTNLRWREWSADLLKRLAQAEPDPPLSPFGLSIVSGREADLPLYAGVKLCDIHVDGVPGWDRAFAVMGGPLGFSWLDGTSRPVHELNEAAALQLREDLVLDYLRWFLFCVRGKFGTFVLIDDPEILREGEVGLPALEKARSLLIPFALLGRDDHGRFLVEASVVCGGSLFTSRFEVEPSGAVEMVSDEPMLILDGVQAPEYPPFPPPVSVELGHLYGRIQQAMGEGE